jgi:4-diphosphocytidyl-2C-methyl-D-erythritol kinase
LDWKAVLGLAITALLLWFVLRGVDFAEVWMRVREGDVLLLLAAVVVATLGFVIRAMRWKILLAPLKPDTSLRSRFASVSVGFMANNVLPARIGEFARAYTLSRVEPVSVSGTFGTLVVERVLDGVTLLGILLLAISWPTFPAAGILAEGPIRAAVDVVMGGIGLMMVGIIVLLVRPRTFVRIAERVALWLPGDFARPIVDALEAFLDSLTVLRSPILLAKAVLWSIGFWVFHGSSFWLGMLAFGIRPQDSFIAALFTESVVAFGVAVPSAPGFFGTFHWAANWALSDVYGVEGARSLAFAFGYHLGGWIPITLIGFWYAWKLGLSLGDVSRSEERVEEAVEAQHPQAARLLSAERREPMAGSLDPRPLAAAVEILAPAKVNLELRVLDRDDATGFHELATVFQAVDLADRLRIEVAPEGVAVDVRGMDVGPARDNLVRRAAEAFVVETGLDTGLRITLEKRIPPGTGLGGGSSDAAATLKALNALFGEPVPPSRLAELAARLGSDVPFFLGPSPLAVGTGRGEELEAGAPLPPAWLLIALPDVHVATAEAYAALDRWRKERGPPEAARPPRPSAPASWEEVARRARNDFEDVVTAAHPPVAEARGRLAGTDPRCVLLSGSGSAVFALYGERALAEAARVDLASGDEGPAVHLVETLTRWPEPELGSGGT